MSIDFKEFETVSSGDMPQKARRGSYWNTLKDFVDSGERAVVRECGSDISKVYGSLRKVAHTPEFSDKVVVVMRGTKVYMMRKGVADA